MDILRRRKLVTDKIYNRVHRYVLPTWWLSMSIFVNLYLQLIYTFKYISGFIFKTKHYFSTLIISEFLTQKIM